MDATRRWVWPWLGAMVLAVLGAAARPACGHGESGPPSAPPPPQPPSGPTEPYVTHVFPPRWSWLHWWEANRDPYLEILRQTAPEQRPAQDVIGAARAKAVAALVKALQDPSPAVRGAAALALGRIGDPAGAAALSALLQKETIADNRCLALVALGLIDSPEAEQALLTYRPRDESENLAVLVAAGLLTQPGDATMKALEVAHGGEAVGAGTVAAWALERRATPARVRAIQDLLQQATSPWLCSGAILALGQLGRAEDVPGLAAILLSDPKAMQVGAWAQLQMAHTEKLRILQANAAARAALPGQYDQYKQAVATYNKNNPNTPTKLQGASITGGGSLVLGPEIIRLADLRGSAAIALSHIDTPASHAALLEALVTRDPTTYKGYGQLFKAHVIMALGQLGDEKAAPELLAILDPKSPRGQELRQEGPKSALRGYAALALGLYSRPVPTPQGPVDHPNYADFCRCLGQIVSDNTDTAEVRCAAAVGLGLTGRTENLPYLHALSNPSASEEPLTGYVILACGMLGDRNIIEPAKRLLAVKENPRETQKEEMNPLLSRRAAILGLGMMGTEEAIPVLKQAWHLKYYENREVCFGLSFLRPYGLTEELVQGLANTPDQFERAYWARCLGDVLLKERPQRLGWLINGSNYMLRNDKMQPFQALANECLYNYLIAAFGSQWQ